MGRLLIMPVLHVLMRDIHASYRLHTSYNSGGGVVHGTIQLSPQKQNCTGWDTFDAPQQTFTINQGSNEVSQQTMAI